MKKQKDTFFEQIWIIRLTSLLIALLLFGYVYAENGGLSTNTANSSISTTRHETISNVPIFVDMDSDKYFISGLPETVTVSLDGPESVMVQTLSANDYQVVTEDLNALGPGEHTIQLSIENLSENIDYQITPSRVNVTIEEKVSAEYPVSVNFDEDSVDENYVAQDAELSSETVLLTGPASTMENVERVYINVSSEADTTESVSGTGVVQVEDDKGNKLNVTVEPQEVKATIPIVPYTKTVPLVLKQTGTPVSQTEYKLEISGAKEVTLTGNRSLLAEVEEISVPVSVTGISASTTQEAEIPLPEGALTASPEKVRVDITASKSESSGGTDTSN